MSTLQIVTEAKQGATVMAPVGRIDATTTLDFENAGLEIVRAGANILVLDFSGVQYISSAGLRSVLMLGKALQERSGALRLANLRGGVAQVFEMSGFSKLFPTYDSAASAIL
jgi:anti-anti-sigma factor